VRELLWLLPLLPFAGALFIALFGGLIGRRGIAAAGCGSVGLSLAAAAAVASGYAAEPGPFRQVLFAWIPGGDGFEAALGFHLDALSLAMACTVCFVGFLIHLYAASYMTGDEGYRRFFAYMNLFVGSMLTLLLADNLLLLYLGWEGVGACSYLLIGFWYQQPENGAAARKAFFTTRVGDAAMAVGLFLLFWEFRTLDFVRILDEAPRHWAAGDPLAAAAGLLLLAGACGKSAQLPLHVWLPDAMAGPTPVSALIHAATMVTAGVYLVARTHVIYELAPAVLLLVGAVGAATALYAAVAALGQRELKRILAYSTISQIGYMFLALGVGAYGAAIFHFMTHAFFKALLFLAAGVVIHAFHGENDVNRMGGLLRRMPLLGFTFIAGSAALAALPLVSSGFYSKDAILHAAWVQPGGGRVLAVTGLVTAFLTALYISRAVGLIFFGRCPEEHLHPGKRTELAVLAVLAVFALIAGFVETPAALGGIHWWQDFMAPVFGGGPGEAAHGRPAGGAGLILTGSLLSLAGIGLAWLLFRVNRLRADRFLPAGLSGFLLAGLGFDWLYERLLLRPYRALARGLLAEPIDRALEAGTWMMRGLSTALSLAHSGILRMYVAGVVLGAVVIVWILAILL
jgi:NADH-quinone oxidoreductase subunit L